jgi:arginyl-tRNA synthetase
MKTALSQRISNLNVEHAARLEQYSDLSFNNLQNDLKIRPPKNPSWGDFCSNLFLLSGLSGDARANHADELLSDLREIPEVTDATLADNGYINVKISPNYWSAQLVEIVALKCLYGRDALQIEEPVKLAVPVSQEDLYSLRQVWNVEALARLSKMWSCETVETSWERGDKRGYVAQGALSKCGENALRLAILGNDPDFSVDFSPVLAMDRTAENPVFFLPFIHSRISALLRTKWVDIDVPDEALLLKPIEGTLLNGAVEQKLAKHLCQWPEIAVKCLREGEMLHLTAFLHEASLLFFKLYNQNKLQSSDYLVAEGYSEARQLLLEATNTLICCGLELMNVDRVEEFI